MRGVYGLLIIGLVLLAVGHLTAERIDYSHVPFSSLNHSSHTGASIWIRLCSIALRVGLVVLLLWIEERLDYGLEIDTSARDLLLKLWGLLATYYALDILLNSRLGLSTTLTTALIASEFVAALLVLCLQRALLIASTFLFILLAFVIHLAEQLSGPNNAFTLFGMAGLALMAMVWHPQWSGRCLLFLYLLPAFGYLFPLAEKLMLNPVGWISGATLHTYGGLYGYSIPITVAFALSWGLLLYQGAFAFLLWRPNLGRWLYPTAMCFHFIAGIALGFSVMLNPWIVSLGMAWAIGESAQLNFASRK